ncbi:MAG TPA: hypothetical protein VG733_20170, partial [Chthoniobacteraceae bacterium]|nr:hypothetical protein [Chthoniobacteraceae bacterium]
MKLSNLLTLACTCAALLLTASALRAADTKADGEPAGVVITPQEGDISPGQILTITFPNAMVKEDDIDAEGHDAPFVSEPRVPGKFVWKSQTEGEFTVGEKLTPGVKYHFSLDPALKDLDGKDVKAAKWGADYTTAEFRFSSRRDDDSDDDNSDESGSKKTKHRTESENIDSQQQVWFNATWPVSYKEAAEHIFFQDRESQQRYPVDILLNMDDTKTDSGSSFGVEPRDPLPVERSFDIVI